MADSFQTEAAKRIAQEDPPNVALAQVPPRIPDEPTRKDQEKQWAVPGTPRYDEMQRAKAQRGIGSDIADGFGMTALAGGIRTITEEAPGLVKQVLGENPVGDALAEDDYMKAGRKALEVAAVSALTLVGYRAGDKDYDKDAKYEELTKGIPFEYHDDIMENDNYEAAARARNRVLQDLDRGRRVAQQDSGQLAVLAGSLFDVDAPATLFSGGAYGASKVASAAIRAAKIARLSPGAALRLSGAAQGLSAGAQAGAIVGAFDAANRETTGWQDMAEMTFQSMLLGGAIGTAVKGDVRTSVIAAQQDFHARVASDAPEYRTHPNVNELQGDNLADYMQQGPVISNDGGESGVGAAQATPGMRMQKPTYMPNATLTPTNQAWIDAASAWRHDSGWADRKAADDDTWWAKVAMSGAMNITTNNFTRLYKSKSAVANFMAGNIFESANGLGRGRATAATRMENYHRRIQQHLDGGVQAAQTEWARNNGHTWQGSGYGITQDGMARFNREVMLELNDRRLGRTSTRDANIRRAADHYELAGNEALGIAKGREGETAVDGFESITESRGYTPYKWSGRKIKQLEDAGVVTRDNLVNALAQAYRQAGLGVGRDANAIAKAVIHRALTKEADMDMSIMSLLTGDGKDFMRESMILGGMKEADADAVLQRLTGAQHNRSKEAFAKSRNDIDMAAQIPTEDGSKLSIVDLFDQDMHGIWQRYTRQMSGAAALARHGITNRAKRREMIDAMRAEQQALGEEPFQAELAEALLSHFNAGPVHGYAAGATNEGIGHAALAKRIANLALLEKLGISQLAETGATIAQNGLASWLQRGPMGLLNREIKRGNQALLDDMAFLTGEIGREHMQFASHLDLDDVSRADKADWLAAVNRYTSVASYVQGYTSLFNQIRGFQQRTTALGMADKVLRVIKEHSDAGAVMDGKVFDRFKNDFGLFEEDIAALRELVENGTVEFQTRGKSTFVNRLNADKWGPEIAEVFASAITRNMNQLVQKSMAGEQDAWMHTHAGSILLHLKTFPLQAMQKQIMRNAKFMDKQALSTLLYGLATAAVASKVRDALDGTERSLSETAIQAFNYSNMTGFIPTLYDPMMTLIGMDGARINQYGPNYDLTPPVVRVANEMLRIPGAIKNTIIGDADWYDQQALKAIPFAGTYVLSRLFD